MLLVWGMKPRIFQCEGKINARDITEELKKFKSLWAAIQKSRRSRSFTSGSNCVKKRWRAAAINALFFICRDILEMCLPFCSFLNSTWETVAEYSRFSKESICMTFLLQRHFLSLLVCVPVVLSRRGKACCLGKKWASACVTNTLPGVFTQPRASSLALKHVVAVTGNTNLSEPPLFRLQVNRGKLYANVTFS